jgi:metallo-beta-lactamase family protein
MHPTGQKEQPATARRLLKQHALGAAHAVTGSLFLYEYFYDGKVTRWLVDVGLTVEDQAADFQKRLPAGITAADINFIIISHAHVDHCGYLPKLVKDGFKGKVFVTPATKDLMSIIMPDSGHLQEEAAKRLNKRFLRYRTRVSAKSGIVKGKGKNNRNGGFRDNRSGSNRFGKETGSQRFPKRFLPLYTEADTKAAMSLLVTVDYHIRRRVNPEIAFTFTDAGHILGSAVVNMEVGSGADKRTICFTGNVGRRDMPLLRELEPVAAADYVLLEATYGNKLHEKRDRQEVLAGIVNQAYKRARRRDPKFGCGVILFPSFAIGRGQTLLSDLRVLMESGRIPTIPVHADGLMMNAATEVYKQHPSVMNDATRKLLEAGKDPYATPRHKVCKEYAESEKLHAPQAEPIIIVASSGMASGGRIMNHLKHWLSGKQNTVVFVGHQGEGTLGETLVGTIPSEAQGGPNSANRLSRTVKIKGDSINVGARIELIPDYSAHADYEDQIAWLKKFKRQPKAVYIVHGDEDGLQGLKGHIQKNLGWKKVIIPSMRQVFEL